MNFDMHCSASTNAPESDDWAVLRFMAVYTFVVASVIAGIMYFCMWQGSSIAMPSSAEFGQPPVQRRDSPRPVDRLAADGEASPGAQHAADGSAHGMAGRESRTASTQAQTKYTWWRATPRFVPLGEYEHGVWIVE